jgi:hypothetical protein
MDAGVERGRRRRLGTEQPIDGCNRFVATPARAKGEIDCAETALDFVGRQTGDSPRAGDADERVDLGLHSKH